jgi:hypothetical protein
MEKYPQFSHQFGPDPRHRPVLHLVFLAVMFFTPLLTCIVLGCSHSTSRPAGDAGSGDG